MEKLATSRLQVFFGKRYRFVDDKKAYDKVRNGGIPGKAVFTMN